MALNATELNLELYRLLTCLVGWMVIVPETSGDGCVSEGFDRRNKIAMLSGFEWIYLKFNLIKSQKTLFVHPKISSFRILPRIQRL